MAKTNSASKRSASSADEYVAAGGELHQQADSPVSTLTTNQGLPVADDQNSLTAGARGPTLLEDFHLREKITHFDHERIPERVVHARGYGAHGIFQAYEGNDELTKADFLCDPKIKTPVFCRFSTVAGSKGSFDTARDVRGWATKFYTRQGNYDLVGNNIPVFFIQDAIKFPDLIHAVKPEPDREFPQAQSAHDTFWDFVSLTPESMHMLMWVMSDRAIISHDARLWRQHFSHGKSSRQGEAGQVSLAAEVRHLLVDLGRGRCHLRRRPRLSSPRFVECHSVGRFSRV
jgi:catalase